MVSIHCVGELARFGGRQRVVQEAIRVEPESVVECPVSAFERDQRGECRYVRVWILPLIVMNVVAVQNDPRILRDVHPVVYKVFRRIMRRRYPKWRVGTYHLKGQTTRENGVTNSSFTACLFNDGADVRKLLLILCTRPIVTANHLVEFCMSASLDFRM